MLGNSYSVKKTINLPNQKDFRYQEKRSKREKEKRQRPSKEARQESPEARRVVKRVGQGQQVEEEEVLVSQAALFAEGREDTMRRSRQSKGQ